MEHYFNVLIESAWAASIVPMSNEATFTAMRLFGGYNLWAGFIISTIGATTGQLFNWYIGHTLLKFRHRYNWNVSDRWYNWCSSFFNKYLLFMLLFSWWPICNILVIVFGFLKTPLRLVAPLLLVGYLFRYGLMIL